MSNKITLNLNQSPYYDDFDENEILYGKKDFKNTSIILKRSSAL